MADGLYGLREIVIDLNTTGAREIKKTPELIAIKAILVMGASGAGAGNIVLREDNASGDVKFRFINVNSASYTFTFTPEKPIWCRGLYMDAIGTAWATPATMIIYCD